MSLYDTIDERLLTFEIAGALFAMPITGVLEVAERSGTARIPTVPESIASVMNYRGDALPVVRREQLLDLAWRLLQWRPEARISAAAALRHPALSLGGVEAAAGSTGRELVMSS